MGFRLGTPLVQQVFDSNGDPLENGTLEFYITGTTTPTSVYSDNIGTAIGTSVTLDNEGRPANSGTAVPLFFDDTVTYKIILKDSAGTEIDPTIDPYSVSGAVEASITALKGLAAASVSNSLVYVSGYYTAGDGGGGYYWFDSTETAADNGGTIIAPNTGTGRWKLIHDGEVTVKQFGARGDSAQGGSTGTDDYTILQAAIDWAESANATLLFPDGVYRCDTMLTLDGSNVTLRGLGTAAINFYNVSTTGGDGQGSNIVLCFNIRGTGRGASSALSANATDGEFSATVASSAAFAADDWVQITSEDLYPFAATSVKRAEVHRVRSVSGSTVNFVDPIQDYEQGYLTADTATLYKLDYIENIELDNLAFYGKNEGGLIQEGVRCNWVRGLKVHNCTFDGFDFFGLNISNCLQFEVDNNYCRGTFYDGVSAGNSFYGIILYHCCQYGEVHHNKGERIRHLVVSSGTSNERGEPLHVDVHHNKIWDPMGGDGGRSFGYENHGYGRHMTWTHNHCSGGYALINIERSDNLVTDNVGVHCAQSAIIIGVTGASGIRAGGAYRNIKVANNKIYGLTDGLDGTAYRSGVEFMATTNSRYENVSVEDNEVYDFESTTTPHHGVRVRAGLTTSKNVTIKGNTIMLPALGGTAAGDTAIYCDSNLVGIKVYGNHIYNYPRAITAEGVGARIVGNDINMDSVPASSFAIYVLANDSVVRGNTVENAETGTRVDATSTGSVVTDNTYIGCTTDVSDAGTSTITAAGNASL